MKRINSLEKQLNDQMKELMAIDIAEVFSPKRVNEFASEYELAEGWSLDLTTCDEKGRPWNFSDPKMRNKAARRVIRDEPTIIIGSPPCICFSQLMRINWSRMDPAMAWTA